MPDDLLARQNDEIATLRERIRQLEEALSPTDAAPPVEWGLTATQARVYAHLASRERATRQSIMTALYGTRPNDDPEMKIVDVFICHIRRKVAPFGVRINTIWGQGYALDKGATP
jgi:two-component system cell cycle response regulator CtrA